MHNFTKFLQMFEWLTISFAILSHINIVILFGCHFKYANFDEIFLTNTVLYAQLKLWASADSVCKWPWKSLRVLQKNYEMHLVYMYIKLSAVIHICSFSQVRSVICPIIDWNDQTVTCMTKEDNLFFMIIWSIFALRNPTLVVKSFHNFFAKLAHYKD